ncbi:type IV pilus modification PilV family protein [Geomonas agri]|uniref:type IV pilus modification PilV family protein n=1 Tax=Geomonas agri TaxID=2873702 RepID=UPI001CD54329|nr:prepilin-type N-terminal cleavage/methylation domain-containing protein [Geomonas agri]
MSVVPVPAASLSSNSGFTLVEMLMALLVMTVGLLGLLQSVNVAYHQNLRDVLRKEATQLAEEQMHDLCRVPFDKISSAARNDKVSQKVVAGILRSFQVDRRQNSVQGATKKLQVTVSWYVKGTRYQHEIFALRSRRGGE